MRSRPIRPLIVRPAPVSTQSEARAQAPLPPLRIGSITLPSIFSNRLLLFLGITLIAVSIAGFVVLTRRREPKYHLDVDEDAWDQVQLEHSVVSGFT